MFLWNTFPNIGMFQIADFICSVQFEYTNALEQNCSDSNHKVAQMFVFVLFHSQLKTIVF